MKVYELMGLLKDCSAGLDVRVATPITVAELKAGLDVGGGLFSITLDVCSLDVDEPFVTIDAEIQ